MNKTAFAAFEKYLQDPQRWIDWSAGELVFVAKCKQCNTPIEAINLVHVLMDDYIELLSPRQADNGASVRKTFDTLLSTINHKLRDSGMQ